MRPNRVLSSVVVVVGSALSRQKFVHVVDWIGGPADGGGVVKSPPRPSLLRMDEQAGNGDGTWEAARAARRAVSDGRRFDMFGHSARLLARKDIFEFPGCTLNRLSTLNVIPIFKTGIDCWLSATKL